jgi:pyruvate dehydrogenase E1 component
VEQGVDWKAAHHTPKALEAQVTRDRYSIITDGLPNQLPDIDPDETREWLQSLDAAIDTGGRQRARFLML